MVFGEPDQWLALLIESLLRRGPRRAARSEELRAARVRGGAGVGRRHRRPAVRVDRRRRFAPRPGARSDHQRPLLLGAVRAPAARSTLEAPEDLRDLVWMPAHLQFENGGESVGADPDALSGLGVVRPTALIALARKTDWEELAADAHRGLGQRILATDAGEAPLLEVRDDHRRSGAERRGADVRRGPWLTSCTPQERLQPALLDRLTDDEPDKKLEPREQRVMSKRAPARGGAARSRLAVQRHPARAGDGPGARCRCARRSVINFGLPALSGQTASSLDVADLERAHPPGDPRLRAAHPARRRCEVTTLIEAGALDHHNVIGVEIRGQLWAQPVPLELLVRTEIDLETGQGRDRRPRARRGWRDGSAAAAVLQPRAAAPARDGRRVRAAVPEDRRAARHERARSRRSVRRAAARRRRRSSPRACS